MMFDVRNDFSGGLMEIIFLLDVHNTHLKVIRTGVGFEVSQTFYDIYKHYTILQIFMVLEKKL